MRVQLEVQGHIMHLEFHVRQITRACEDCMLYGELVDKSGRECREEEATQSMVGELLQCCDLSL